MPSPLLRIQLLGDFLLTCGDNPITAVRSPRLQSLFAYLVLHRDAPQSRQHLAFCLWPDSSESQARTNLRYLFHSLRQALPESDRFFHSDSLTIQWRGDTPLVLDVLEFENAVASANSFQTWQEAVNSYHGDLLPSGYDDWILLERNRLRQKFVGAVEQLCNLLEAEGDYTSAIRHAQRLLQCEPLREDTYGRLMRLHALSGDPAGVVRVFNTCATVLQRELGIEPSAETQHARQRFLKMSTTADSAHRMPLAFTAPRLGNLPHPLTSFVGRERQVSEVKQLLASHRFLTLTGAGGIGKTRLALAVASDLIDNFPDGIWWADLAPLADPQRVSQQVASAVGVREEPGRSLDDTLVDYVRDKTLLLGLDNCEHLLEPIGRLAENLLQAAPRLSILVTSRESLRIAGETMYRVPALSLPRDLSLESTGEESPASALRQSESVRLFLDRAASTLPTFAMLDENAAAIAQTCRRLDGIPLAIELAAARIKLLSVAQIAERLDDCFQLLAGGSRTALPRYQTLRETMDWSHGLLSEKEQILFRRLSVFAGGFTLPAAEQVAGETEPGGQDTHPLATSDVLDVLSSLVDKSLVITDQPRGETRFRLHEITRQYARIKLREAGEEAHIRNRHLYFYCRLAEALEPGTPGAPSADALNRLAMENDNLRAALEWGTREPVAGRSYADQNLTLYREADDKPGMAWTLSKWGFLLGSHHDYATAASFLQQSLALYRALGDRAGMVDALCMLGHVVLWRGDSARARSLLEESLVLVRDLKDPFQEGRLQWSLGHVALREGNYAQAHSLYAQALTLLRGMGHLWGVFYVVDSFGRLAVAEGQCERAARLFGLAEHLGETIGTSLAPPERVQHEPAVAAARTALGELRFAEAWAEGRGMALEQGIAYALQEPVP